MHSLRISIKAYRLNTIQFELHYILFEKLLNFSWTDKQAVEFAGRFDLQVGTRLTDKVEEEQTVTLADKREDFVIISFSCSSCICLSTNQIFQSSFIFDVFCQALSLSGSKTIFQPPYLFIAPSSFQVLIFYEVLQIKDKVSSPIQGNAAPSIICSFWLPEKW